MRYLIERVDLSPELERKYKDSQISYERYVRTYSYVFFCAECGAELYSEYAYEDASTTNDESDRREMVQLKRKLSNASSDSERRSIRRQIREKEKAIEVTKASMEHAREGYFAALESALVCPVCGAQLHQKKGYFFPGTSWFNEQTKYHPLAKRLEMLETQYGVHKSNYSMDSIFNSLKDTRTNIERNEAKTKVNEYTNICDIFVAGNMSPKASEIKRDDQLLKKYILNLIHLESNIYSLQQQLIELYYRRMENNRAVVFDIYSPVYQVKEELKGLRQAHQNALDTVSNAKNYQPLVSVDYPDEPSAPILGTPGLFNKKKVLAENDALTKQYQAAMDAYRKEVSRCDEKKAHLITMERNAFIENAQRNVFSTKTALDCAETELNAKIKVLKDRPIPAKAAKVLLDQEIAAAEELLKNSYAARNELYAYDIVFGKYRNQIALSSFYEYLMSGRCSTLEGVDGAYNIYENEIRLNRVIAQLDQVIDSLELIKESQYMMYQEMRITNSLLSSLNSTMDKALTSIQGIEANTTQMNEYMGRIAENSDVIAHNSAVTAYYSKVNAELTNALGFMMAYKL